MNIQFLIYFSLPLNIGVSCKYVKIIGGEDADITDYPYSVSLRSNEFNAHFCGGSIISEWHVLTAAHCILSFDITQAVVYTGTTDIQNSNGLIYAIESFNIHPDYTGEMKFESMNRYDIGIIKVKDIIIFNKFQNKIELPTENAREKDQATLTGWGAISYPEQLMPEKLQKVVLKVLDNFECSEILPFTISDEQMCVFEARGIGACIADSGSPLVSNRKLIGISSFLHPCATDAPDIYTRVYPYVDYINSVINV